MDSAGEASVRGRFRFLLKLPALALAAGMWYLSSQPVLPKPEGLLGFDKFQHFLAYFALAAAIALWFSREEWRRSVRSPVIGDFLRHQAQKIHKCNRLLGPPALTAALGSLYGIIDEIHQHFVPGRNCDIRDWFSDTLGALVAVTAIKLALGCAPAHRTLKNHRLGDFLPCELRKEPDNRE
jgi:VanZ family protein